MEETNGLFAVGRGHCLVVLVAEIDLQPLPQSRFVFDDQNLRHDRPLLRWCSRFLRMMGQLSFHVIPSREDGEE
jgi:hypothetical protein